MLTIRKKSHTKNSETKPPIFIFNSPTLCGSLSKNTGYPAITHPYPTLATGNQYDVAFMLIQQSVSDEDIRMDANRAQGSSTAHRLGTVGIKKM